MDANILIVEDSISIRESLKYILTTNGYSVVEAIDGIDGMEKLQLREYSCIITDINMPNMNGLEFIKGAREMEAVRYVPIVVLTTESQYAMLQQGMKAGATAWIVKPFNEEKLLNTINKVIT